MTREEKIEILEKEKAYMLAHGGDRQAEALTSAIKALEQEPSGDRVSRGVFEQVVCERDVAIEQLKELGYGLGEKPKTGHWIEDEYEMEVRCSVCGEENDKCSKYCPDCGAKMVAQESEGMNDQSI